MKFSALGSTIRKAFFNVWRAVRVDDDGYLQTVAPGGLAAKVDLTEIDSNAVVDGGINGSLAVGGAAAVGDAPTSNPNPAGTIDGGGLSRIMLSDANGRPQVDLDRVSGTDVLTALAGMLATGGDVAHGVAKSASAPNKQGAVARSTLPTPVAEGQIVELVASLFGELLVKAKEYSDLPAAARGVRVNPKWDRNFETILADETNVADGTYEYYFTPSKYSIFTLAFDMDGGTAPGTGVVVTLEGMPTVGSPMVTPAEYRDITFEVFGVANWTAVTGATLIIDFIDNLSKLKGYQHCRLVVAVDTDAADADYTFYLRMGVL